MLYKPAWTWQGRHQHHWSISKLV